MFSPGVRILLIFAAFGMGGALLLQRETAGLFFIAAGAFLAWGYLRHGSVYAAFWAYRKGDIERARGLLSTIRNPDHLTRQDRAYYHLLQGLMLAQDGEIGAARAKLEAALEGPFRTQNDGSLAHYLLAEWSLLENDTASAREHLERARALRCRPEVGTLIRNLDEQLNQRE